MISHIKTKGFKGQNIDEDIHPKTLFCGKNKSGKSSRAHAIALTILGYIPFVPKTNKKPADILNDFGQGKTLTTSIVCNGVEFERHYSRSGKGSVSQRLRVDKKKYPAAEFAVELSKAGAPKIIDVNAFIGLSDQKKIDTLFELYPPKADLKNLNNQIEKAKTKISRLQSEDRSATSVIQRLTKSKNEIELPAGSLAEIKEEIKKIMGQVKDAQDNLKAVEIEQAKNDEQIKAAKKAKQEKIKNDAARKEQQDKFNKIMSDKTEDSSLGNQRIYVFASGKDKTGALDPVQSIQRILDALNDSSCQICAAAIVAKVELKKFKQEAAA